MMRAEASIDILVDSFAGGRMNGNRGVCLLALLYQWQTALVILINRDAIKALKALAVIDLACWCDRLIFAAMPAGLAGRAAGISSWYP